MAKREISISPAGKSMYPRLAEPDTKFKAEGEYSVRLLLTEQDALPILERCEALRQQAFDEEVEKVRAEKPKMSLDKIKEKITLADLPIRAYEDPETGEDTGLYQINFKMVASGVSKKTGRPWSRHPAVFDSQNKAVDPKKVQIWSGSILKVAYSLEPFCTSAVGAGVSARLEAVQIIELVSGGNRDAAGYGFGAQEGGYSHNPEEEGSEYFDGAADVGGPALAGGDPAEADF